MRLSITIFCAISLGWWATKLPAPLWRDPAKTSAPQPMPPAVEPDEDQQEAPPVKVAHHDLEYARFWPTAPQAAREQEQQRLKALREQEQQRVAKN